MKPKFGSNEVEVLDLREESERALDPDKDSHTEYLMMNNMVPDNSGDWGNPDRPNPGYMSLNGQYPIAAWWDEQTSHWLVAIGRDDGMHWEFENLLPNDWYRSGARGRFSPPNELKFYLDPGEVDYVFGADSQAKIISALNELLGVNEESDANEEFKFGSPASPVLAHTPKKKSNILDPINETLDPTVWDGSVSVRPTMRLEHKQWIEKIITDRFNDQGYDVQNWGTLYVTGSITTYQYSEDSDIDVSLFVDAETFPEWSRAEMIGIAVETLDGSIMPMTTHPLQVFIVPEGIFPADLYKKGLRSGYNLREDHWINPPDREMARDPELIYNSAYTNALEQADKMERLLRYEPHKAKTFWHQIHKRRRVDQKAGKGDFAPSNLVYKMLANRGLLDQISQSTGEYIAKTNYSGLIKDVKTDAR